MALSNIFREPQREITETAIGVLVVGPILIMTYIVGHFFADLTWNPQHIRGDNGALEVCPYPVWLGVMCILSAIAGLITFGVSSLIAIITHDIGEGICDKLQRDGIHLRPRNRR